MDSLSEMVNYFHKFHFTFGEIIADAKDERKDGNILFLAPLGFNNIKNGVKFIFDDPILDSYEDLEELCDDGDADYVPIRVRNNKTAFDMTVHKDYIFSAIKDWTSNTEKGLHVLLNEKDYEYTMYENAKVRSYWEVTPGSKNQDNRLIQYLLKL